MLHPLDWVLIAAYLAGIVAVGLLASGRQRSADDYFTGGAGLAGRLGSVLVGLSIAATFFSGISFLAYPSVIYAHGLTILAAILVFPAAWVVLVYWFLPRFLPVAGREPYEVLERHFDRSVRGTAASLYVLLRVGWMATLIYAPTLAIMAAAALDDRWFWPIVITIGLSSTVYTVVGGIRGVIITDAIQMLVIIGGILVTLGYVAWNLPEPLVPTLRELAGEGRLTLFDPSLSVTQPLTTLSVLVGAAVANFACYIADQMSLQRYLVSADPRDASRAFAVNVVGVVAVLLLLAGVGVAMAAWYHQVADPALPEPDRVFPYFVATRLPTGVAGLLLAAILAATMSSMTSGINTLSATITLDLRGRFGRPLDPAAQLRFARMTSLAIGLAATLAAGLVGRLGSLFDIAQSLLGVFLGPLMACVLLAIARVPRPAPRAMSLGMVVGCLLGWATIFSPIYALWVPLVAFGGTLATAAALGALWRREAPPAAAPEANEDYA